MRLEAILSSPNAIWATYDEVSAQSLDAITARIEQDTNQIVFGAIDGDQPVGIAGLRREPLAQVAHKAVLWGVYVDANRRKEGIARQLFSCVRSHAMEIGVLQIMLSVNVENDKAKSLYESLGFLTFGVEPRSMRVGDLFFAEEHMILRLDK